MAKVSEVVAILKKQSDLIGKLRSEKVDLLAALRVLAARTETRIDYCFCETAKAIDGDLPCLFCLKQQARAAIERAEGK